MRVVSSVLFCIIVITVSAAMYVLIIKEKKSRIVCHWELELRLERKCQNKSVRKVTQRIQHDFSFVVKQ